MYTVDDIQRIFSIGRTKAYQLMCSSGFPAIRLNKKLLVSKEKLEEWIRKNSGKTYNYVSVNSTPVKELPDTN